MADNTEQTEKNFLLSLDIGGTYIKAAVFDRRGRQLGLAKQYNHCISRSLEQREYDPDELWNTSCSCISEVLSTTLSDPAKVACIGISAQGSGCYFMDQSGNKVRNFLSSGDGRARAVIEQWKKQGIYEKLFPLLSYYPTQGDLAPILAWIKQYEPENYAKIRWAFSMKDYLAYRLTGNIVNGIGCASRSGLMDMNTGTFTEELANLTGLKDKQDSHGRLVWDTEICGTVSVKAAEECGCSAGTPVASGSHDVIATAIAMGCVDPAYCFVVMGTCSINGYISSTPVKDGTIRFNEKFACPGSYLIEQPGSASSAVLEWVIDVLFDRTRQPVDQIYAEINEQVASVEPEKADLLFLPNMRGHYAAPDSKGAWIGLTPLHTKAHMLRAVYEGIVFAHMAELEKLFSNRQRPDRIRLSGGAVNSAVWVHIFADALQIPIEIVPKEEMTAKGAAIAASVAAGIYPDIKTAIGQMTAAPEIVFPQKDLKELYQHKFRKYCECSKAMNPVWNILK